MQYFYKDICSVEFHFKSLKMNKLVMQISLKAIVHMTSSNGNIFHITGPLCR